jgi:glucose-6-phosphate isomerase
MAPNTTNPTETLLENYRSTLRKMQNASMLEMFHKDVARTEKFNLKWNDFLIDYSKHY